MKTPLVVEGEAVLSSECCCCRHCNNGKVWQAKKGEQNFQKPRHTPDATDGLAHFAGTKKTTIEGVELGK